MGGNINIFEGNRRVSLIGLSNNINQQNFSSEDILGITGGSGQGRGGFGGFGGSGGSRGGRGNFGGGQSGGGANNFLVGQQNGITTTNSFGFNYSDNWGKKLKVSGSYFFNGTDNITSSNLSRNYYSDSSFVYHEGNSTDAQNTNHRINMRFEYTIDSFNSIIFTPGISFQDNNSNSGTNATDSIGGKQSVATYTYNTTRNNGYSSSDNLLIQHKFKKNRRTISLNINSSLSEKTGDGTYYSDTRTFVKDTVNTLRDQHYSLYNNTNTISTNLTYTEPVGEKGQIMANYNPSFSWRNADKETKDYDTSTKEYDLSNAQYSNKYYSTYNTQRGGLSYRVGDRKLNFNAGVNVQYATLSGDQQFPTLYNASKNFTNLLPNAMFNYRYSDGRNLRIMYRTNTAEPSISQLQNVVDISNPLLLKTGNANLKQDYEQTFIVRYGLTKGKSARNFFLNLYVNYVDNYIGNRNIIAVHDTAYYKDPVAGTNTAIAPGSQLSLPVNLAGYWNTRSFLTYGIPVDFIKSNLNINGGFNFSRNPGMIDSVTNYSSYYTPSFGVVLSSNISEKVDFTLAYSGNYNVVKNTVQSQANSTYFNHTTSLRFNLMFLKHFVFNTNVTHNYYTAFSGTGDQSFILWNAYLGYKMLKNQALEARVSVYDILNQNRSISRAVTDLYVENNVTQVLKQYFMFQLTYTLRNFKGGTNTDQHSADENRPPRQWGDHMH